MRAFPWPLIAWSAIAASQASPQQPSAQNPSPMVDHTRPHPRIAQAEATGRRVDLKSLKGARLFVTAHVNPDKPVPLLIHFHGAPWLIEQHIARSLPRAALITVQLGEGSSAYGRPFEQPDLFRALIDEAGRELSLKRGWSSITLSGFSAGYGAVRQILRRPEYFELVNNVLLLDGMHTSYVPEGKVLAEGGALDPSGLDAFVKFAREAVAGTKSLVFTHSEIFPGTYASTTECADYLLALAQPSTPCLAAHGSNGDAATQRRGRRAISLAWLCGKLGSGPRGSFAGDAGVVQTGSPQVEPVDNRHNHGVYITLSHLHLSGPVWRCFPHLRDTSQASTERVDGRARLPNSLKILSGSAAT
jgi:hypothetical protein